MYINYIICHRTPALYVPLFHSDEKPDLSFCHLLPSFIPSFVRSFPPSLSIETRSHSAYLPTYLSSQDLTQPIPPSLSLKTRSHSAYPPTYLSIETGSHSAHLSLYLRRGLTQPIYLPACLPVCLSTEIRSHSAQAGLQLAI